MNGEQEVIQKSATNMWPITEPVTIMAQFLRMSDAQLA